jgi:hypothetical protein
MLTRLALPDFAREALHENERPLQIADTEADIWLQIAQIEEEIASLPLLGNARLLEAKREKLRKQLHPQSRQLLGLPEYRAAILRIFKFPGHRGYFRPHQLGNFTHGRTIKVCICRLF